MAQDEIVWRPFPPRRPPRWTVDQRDEGPSKFQMCSAHLVLKPTYKPWPNPRVRPYSPNSAGARKFYSSPRRRRSPRLATPAAGAASAISLAGYLPSARYPAETPKPSGYLRIIAIHLVLSIRVWSSRLGLNSSFSQNSGGICVHRCHYEHGIVWNGLPRGASKESWLEEMRSL